MTRARARALETEVTYLLSQFHFDAHETWLLPQMETLCILSYQGVSHGEAKDQGESEEEDGREDGDEEEEKNKVSRLRTTDEPRTSDDLQAPDDRH